MEENNSKKNINEEVKNDKKQNPTSSEENLTTIMPTMIDDSEERVLAKRDLSSIIPQNNGNVETNENSIELISKDNNLKSDGTISLGMIDNEGTASVYQNIILPEQIDIEQRKIEAQKSKNVKKKKEKLKPTKATQKLQNTTSLIALGIIAFLIGFVIWYKFSPTEEDFVPLTVHVELGDSLPIKTESYVKPGKGTSVDGLLYALDLSNINVSEVGEYNFTITFKNIKKTGKVIIEDTTAPELEVRDLTITEGTEYNASSFIETCRDYSGCNYSFQDSETQNKYTTAGSYTVYVIATDAYQNSVTKKVNLFIQSQGSLRTYSKQSIYNNDNRYEIEELYSLRFAHYESYSLLINGTHKIEYKYQDRERYETAKDNYLAEENYSFDDSQMIITHSETINYIGSNYTRLTDIDNYLLREGFNVI